MEMKIGSTPMIKIYYKFQGKEKYIYVKLEYYNFTGSIKDRVAYYIINESYKTGQLVKGQEIVETTSGNTGISLAAIGAYYKHPVHIFMPDWMSEERLKIMKMYNAKVTLVSKKDGGFRKALEIARKYAKENNAFLSNQFANTYNTLAHYETTGKEIVDALNGNIGGFVSGIGTGGTLMGVGRRIKVANAHAKVYALEPEKMPLLSKNMVIGNHKIEGIGDDFVPALVDKRIIDKVFLINDDDAINMSRLIAIKLGIGVGISSGANFIASVMANERNFGNIATVFVDDNKKYLSTELSKQVDQNRRFWSNNIKLVGFESV